MKIIFTFVILISINSIYSQSLPNYLIDGFLKKEVAKSLKIKCVTEYECNYLYGKPDMYGNIYIKRDYDTNGNIIKITKYDKKIDKKIFSIEINYDNKENITKLINYDNNTNVKYRLIFKYDAIGNVVEAFKYINNWGKFDDRYIYKYNETNQLIEERHEFDEYYYCNYEYDYLGRMKSLHEGRLGTDDTIEFEIEYDTSNNVTKLIVFQNDYYYTENNSYTSADKIFQTFETNTYIDGTIDSEYRYDYKYDKNILKEKTKHDLKTLEAIEMIKYEYEFY